MEPGDPEDWQAYPPPHGPSYTRSREPDEARGYGEHYSKGHGSYDIERQVSQFAFDSKSVRAAFVRKVFSIVTAMILVVIVMVTPAVVQDDIRMFMIENRWVYMIALVLFFCSYIILVCCQGVARSFPLNLCLLALFTVSCGVMLMVLCALVPPHTVLLALVTTTLACIAIIGFASQTKYDITSHIFIVFVATIAVFIFGLILAVMSFFIYIKALHVIFSAIVCVLFMVWLAIDTQMIIGGKRYEISPEEYIFAALMLFIDIYEIFITLLSLFNAANN
ncbi:unnamed protein product [Cylicocyclus nassatus]|uniref:Protein lifeguard 1 n=1 Tax=Cylicocyclus nassatus TaxID=53992 RepID=A0AA36H8Z6_CYLNA|nr:unnamed protein product [Cylicocyclus nassatus]